MAMAVMVVMMMAVIMTVTAGSRVARGGARRRNASISLQLLHTSSVHVSGISARSLQTSVRQEFDNGFEILHSALRRPRQSNDQGLVTNPGDWPGHHGN